MKTNPLVVFTGAALATLAALAGLNMSGWLTGPAAVQKEAVAATEPATGEIPPVVAGTPPEPAIKAPEPLKVEPETKPEFDTVRVEADGRAIVAGRAKPGAEITLRLGGSVIGKAVANGDGAWVVVPEAPLLKGAHEITIEQKTGDSPPVMAEQSIAVAVPDETGKDAMVALTEPGAATKVLPQADQQQASAQPETPPVEETAKIGEAATAPEQPAGKIEEPAKGEEPSKTAGLTPLNLDAVDYNDKGDIIFSGRARPGTAVRLYVDNNAIGDAIVNSQGSWSFAGNDVIAPGKHALRADQIDSSGKVVARIELPFQREQPEAVAALNLPPPETAEPPANEPAAAEPVTPEPTTTEPTATEPAATEPSSTEMKTPDVGTNASAADTTGAQEDPAKPRSGKVVIQPGNNLWKLSRVIYGKGVNFTVIYDANKEQIRDPDLIYPGQIFAVPNASPPEMIDPKRKEPLTSAEGGTSQ